MIEHLETVHEEENKGWNKRNLAPTNSSDGKFSPFRVKLGLLLGPILIPYTCLVVMTFEKFGSFHKTICMCNI